MTLKAARELQGSMFRAVRETNNADELRQRLDEIVKAALAKSTEAEQKEFEKMKPAVAAQQTMLLSPWFRYFLTYDPAPTLAKVKCPVLAINGEKDVQVSPRENLEGIEKALKAGGNSDVTVQELKHLNHLFQTCKSGAVSEYGTIDETFAPSALELISEWIVKRIR